MNGYRRFRPNSLAPDRAGWGYDHRGAMIRVLGGAGDPATRMENRGGEPAANPYLYMASQLVAGRDGIEANRDPGPQDDEPYQADRPALPPSLPAALDALEKSALFRREFGDDLRRLLPAAEAERGRPVPALPRGAPHRGPAGRADGVGAERVLRLLLRRSPMSQHDLDELVQEDRVHRLLYTDPAIFARRDDAGLRRHLGLSRPREPDPAERRLRHRPARPAPADRAARQPRHDPRAVQPLHAPRHDALPAGPRLGEGLPVPVPRLDVPQQRQAARACRGPTATRATSRTQSSTSRRCRGSRATAASSSAR